MKNDEKSKEILFEKICNDNNKYFGTQKYPDYGEIVLLGLIHGKPYTFDHAIGYVVQIRKNRGEYNSDQFLIRHPNGSLIAHENQVLWLVSEKLAQEALSKFVVKPEEEGGDNEYTIKNSMPEKGYII